MAGNVRYPSLYQINTRVWLRRLSRQHGKRVTLKEVPDEELDRIAGLGFDWVWLLSVWQMSEARPRRLARPSGLAEGISRDSAQPDRGRHLRSGLHVQMPISTKHCLKSGLVV